MHQYFPSSAFKDSQLMVRSPGRINLIGEHTDYNSGLCLPAAISQSIYFGIQSSDKRSIKSLDRNEECTEFTNRFDWEVYFKSVLDLLQKEGFSIPGFKIFFGGDLPSGAGLSSSSSITCGFAFILNEFFSLGISKPKLTEFAVKAEKANGLMGGMMDQISIMNGLKNHALFIDCADWSFKTIPIHLENKTWLIVDTKVKHKLVDSDYNKRSISCQSIQKKLFENNIINSNICEVTENQLFETKKYINADEFTLLEYVVEENQRVLDFVFQLKNNNTEAIGHILLKGHEGLRNKYKVTCEELDFLIDIATKDSQCLGARMMGGGFGGSTIHLISSESVEEYSNKITQLYNSRFGFNPHIFKALIEDGVHIFDSLEE